MKRNMEILGVTVLVMGIFLFTGYFTETQAIQEEGWIRAIGGDKKSFTYAPSVIVTDDGFIEIGYCDVVEGNKSFDFCIVKWDKSCMFVSAKAIGTKNTDG